jgi:hypothetical protein
MQEVNKEQETLEEAAERLYPISKGGSMWMPSKDDCNKANKQEGFIEGAKWQEERMYSEEDMRKAFIAGGNSQIEEDDDYGTEYDAYMEKWLEQHKKK